MSRSIHITKRNFKGLSQKEINEQYRDVDSDLNMWYLKSIIKKAKKKARKNIL